MTEPATRSELSQVLDAIQGMQGNLQAMEAALQAIDKKLDIHIATSNEKFQRLEDKIDAVEAKLEQQINAVEAKLGQRIDTVESTLQDIAKRQAGTDARLWGFLVTLLVATVGLLTKVLFFDLPRP